MSKNKINRIPKEEDLILLPRWALVAFAARCSRRILPLYWVCRDENYCHVVEESIKVVEELSEAGDHYSRIHEVEEISHEAYASGEIYEQTYPRFEGFQFGALAASYSASFCARYAIRGDLEGLRGKVLSLLHQIESTLDDLFSGLVPLFEKQMTADFNLLLKEGLKNSWDDDSVIPKDFFEPIWSEFVPEGWIESEAESNQVTDPKPSIQEYTFDTKEELRVNIEGRDCVLSLKYVSEDGYGDDIIQSDIDGHIYYIHPTELFAQILKNENSFLDNLPEHKVQEIQKSPCLRVGRMDHSREEYIFLIDGIDYVLYGKYMGMHFYLLTMGEEIMMVTEYLHDAEGDQIPTFLTTLDKRVFMKTTGRFEERDGIWEHC